MSNQKLQSLQQRSAVALADQFPLAVGYATGAISGATQANPVVLTITGHSFANGDQIYITGVGGMTELNGNTYTVAGATTNTVQLSGIDGTTLSAYTSGGTAIRGRLLRATISALASFLASLSQLLQNKTISTALNTISTTPSGNLTESNLDAALAGTQGRLDIAARGICDFRLTLESGVPVSTTDQTAKSTLYFTPYTGNRIGLHDGVRWGLKTSAEISLTLSGLTSGKNYDVFVYNNSGTLTLELSAAWTNDTTRATAITHQDGIYVKSGVATRRWVGTIRTTGATTTEYSRKKRFVLNVYNQVPVLCSLVNTTSHTYASGTIRQWNNDAANQIEFLLPEARSLGVTMQMTIGANASAPQAFAICGLDSPTGANFVLYSPNTQEYSIATTRSVDVPMGYHRLCLNQATNISATFLVGILETFILM